MGAPKRRWVVHRTSGSHHKGDTVEEALANAREAIGLYIESLMADNLPIPPSDEVIATVEVPVASPAAV